MPYLCIIFFYILPCHYQTHHAYCFFSDKQGCSEKAVTGFTFGDGFDIKFDQPKEGNYQFSASNFRPQLLSSSDKQSSKS